MLHDSRVMDLGSRPDELTYKIYALCPLGFFLNKPWIASGARDEVALRAVPLLAGIAAVGLLGWLSMAEFGPLAGATATLLLAFNPYHVEMSQYGRYYALVFLLANLSLLLLGRALRTHSLLTLAMSQAALLLAVLSHLPAAFLWPAQLLFLLVHWHGSAGNDRQRRFLRRALAVLLVMHLAVLIYLVPAVGLWRDATAQGARSPRGLLAGWVAGAGIGVAALNAAGIVYLLIVRQRRVWLPLAAQLVPCGIFLALAVMDKTVMPRYGGYVYFPMFLVCGLVIDRVCGGWEGVTTRPVAAVSGGLLVLLALAPSLPSLASHHIDGNRHNFPACVALMRPYVQEGGLVFSSWPHVFAYHAERILDVPVLRRDAAAEDLKARVAEGNLVVVPATGGPPGTDPRLPYVHENSLWAVRKVERSHDDSPRLARHQAVPAGWEGLAKFRVELSAPRYDHRRN
ncbi:MAG: hypothetical protein GTO03_18030, partial [Planctomycetales bacterium]|nr:hypothetical protein [Planctomycetales bacterium]